MADHDLMIHRHQTEDGHRSAVIAGRPNRSVEFRLTKRSSPLQRRRAGSVCQSSSFSM